MKNYKKIIFNNTDWKEWLFLILLNKINHFFDYIEPSKRIFYEGDLSLSYNIKKEEFPYFYYYYFNRIDNVRYISLYIPLIIIPIVLFLLKKKNYLLPVYLF